MNLVQGLPMTRNRHNTILVVVDKLTKVVHFIQKNLTDGAPIIAQKIIKSFFIYVGYQRRSCLIGMLE